jgi:STE24 endopeptidase
MIRNTDIRKTYNKKKYIIRFTDIILGVIFLILFQLFFSFRLQNLIHASIGDFYINLGIYAFIFSLIFYLFSLPLHFYSSFLLEHEYKLSNQKLFAWLSDEVKGGILSFLVFMLFINVLYFLLRNFENSWWIILAFFWFIITVVIANLIPVLVLPLFFKVTPVSEELKRRIVNLSEKCGVKIVNVYKIDFSKKTNKTNAAVIGVGNTRRVLLADNLIENFNEEETDGVLAHEFGHHKYLHMWKMLVFGLMLNVLTFFIIYILSKNIIYLLGVENIYDIAALPALMLILSLMNFLILPIKNGFSRLLENEADSFALRKTNNKKAFISLMEKLAIKNLADPNPPFFIKIFFYSHPPVRERIKRAELFN